MFQEEARLEAMEAEDIRLKPFVRRLCEGAIDKHCKNVDPGEVRVLTCLKEKAGDAGFPAQCGHLMKKEVSRAAARTSLNPRVVSGGAHITSLLQNPLQKTGLLQVSLV
jgi:hypothetical protein